MYTPMLEAQEVGARAGASSEPPIPKAVVHGSRISPMEPFPRWVKLGTVIAGYVAVILVAAVLVHFQHMQHVSDFNAQMSGRVPEFHPFSDWMAALGIGGLFLIPTFLLVLMIRESEAAFTNYSKILLAFSVTGPICALVAFPAGMLADFLLKLCFFRLYAMPAVIVGMVASWLFARFNRAKRLILYALLVEVGTFILGLTFFVYVFSHIRI